MALNRWADSWIRTSIEEEDTSLFWTLAIKSLAITMIDKNVDINLV